MAYCPTDRSANSDVQVKVARGRSHFGLKYRSWLIGDVEFGEKIEERR
jgi:hypothetical protein